MRPVRVGRVRHAVWLDRLRVDLRAEEVVDAVATRTRAVERRVDRVLVRPGGAHAGVLDDLEDRVDLQVVPRHDRLAGLRVDREGRRVQPRLRVRGQVHDLARVRVVAVRVDRAALVEGRERAGRWCCREQVRHGVELVVRRVVDHVATRDRTRAVRGAGREHAVAVLDVVVHAGRARVAAGHQRGAARIGVRRVRRVVVGELGATGGEPGELRARMVGDVPVEVGLVHTVDRDQQHVRDRVLAVVAIAAIAATRVRGHGGCRAADRAGGDHRGDPELRDSTHAKWLLS